MKNLSRIVSIMLVFVILFSLYPNVAYADNLLDSISSHLSIKEMHATDKETNEVSSQTFITLPGASLLPEGFSYDDETGKIKYKRQRADDPRNVSVEILYDGRVISTSDILHDTANGNYYITVPPSPDGSGNYESYKDKELEVVLTYDNGTEVSAQRTIDYVSSVDVTPGDSVWDWLWDNIFSWLFKPVEKALRVLEEIFTGLLLSLGDEVIVQVSSAVGEQVTLDTIIFGGVTKVSVDFWGSPGALASKLKGVVTPWYNTFSAIAIVIFLAILLVIGVQIIFSSTGSSRSKYQMLLVDWVIGVALLFLFPYVMRIAVNANDALVKSISPGSVLEPIKEINSDEESRLLQFFGANDFVKQVTGVEKPDTNYGMMYIRYLAGRQGRIPLAVVYLIMVAQVIIILFVYYKRAFMVAFLIVIFPLVSVTYTMDKLRWWCYTNSSF